MGSPLRPYSSCLDAPSIEIFVLPLPVLVARNDEVDVARLLLRSDIAAGLEPGNVKTVRNCGYIPSLDSAT